MTIFEKRVYPLVKNINELVEPKINHLSDLKRPNYIPLNRKVTILILEFLDDNYDDIELNVLEALIRILGLAKEIKDTSTLIKIFEKQILTPYEIEHNSGYSSLSWAVANTLSLINAPDLCGWLQSTIKKKKYGNSRQMLCYAIVRNCERSIAKETLQEIFNQLPGHAADAYYKIVDVDDEKFFKQKLNSKLITSSERWVIKAVEKNIRKISRLKEKRKR